MKRLVLTLITLACVASPVLARAAEWTVDTDHSAAHFQVQHMMIADVQGSFPDVRGVALIDEQDLGRSKIDVTIAAASIDTGVAKRDAHLRSPDFFDVEQFPTLTFTSTEISAAGEGRLKVLGDLTLHGVTRKVELRVVGPSEKIKDPWGNTRKGAKATTRINRKDFGIVWNATLDNGGLLIGDEVQIEIDLELIQQAG